MRWAGPHAHKKDLHGITARHDQTPCASGMLCAVWLRPSWRMWPFPHHWAQTGSTLLWLCGPDNNLSDAHSATKCLKCLCVPFRCLGAQLTSFRRFGMSRWKKKKKRQTRLAHKTKLQQHTWDVVLGVKCQHHHVVAWSDHVGVVMFSCHKVQFTPVC